MKQVYVDKKTGTIRIVMRDRTKIGTMTIQSDTEMNTDEDTAIEHLILDRSTRIYGEGSIGLAEINANGVNIERFPKKIKIKDGLKAIVEGKEYPSSPHHQDETMKDMDPAGDSGRSGGGSGNGNGSDSGSSGGDDSKVSVTGITLDHAELTLKVGETVTLTATVLPANAANRSVIWSSDNESVAEVAEGVVTAKSVGMATIMATTIEGGFVATSRITVFVPAAKPSIASAEITPDNELIITFDTVTNQSGALPDRAAVDAVIDWGGKSPGVDYSGSWNIVVSGQSVLTIVITDPTGRTLDAGDTISIKSSANVRDENNTSEASDASSVVSGSWVIPVAGITLDHSELTLKIGETATLTATILPSNATNKSVIWSSDNESVAEVADGVVTAKSSGMATIKATTVDGGITASSQIHVRNGRADVEISASDLPVIQQYPFALSIRNAFDEKETKVDGDKRVSVTVEDGDPSATIFDDTVWFNQGDASVTKLKIPSSGNYQLIITIEGIWEPIVTPDVEVVHVLEAVLRAQTEDELYRALSALGMLHPGEFDSDSIVMNHLLDYLDDFAVSKPRTAAEVQTRVNEVNDRTIAPQFVAGFPFIDELYDTRFDFRLKLNKNGTVYYLVVADGALSPTPEEVKAGNLTGV